MNLLSLLLACVAFSATTPAADEFARKFRDAVEKKDLAALKSMFHADGGDAEGLKFNEGFFKAVPNANWGAASILEVLPPARQKWVKGGCTHRPNLTPLHMLNLDYAEKGTGGFLFWLAKKDSAYVIATTIAENCLEPGKDRSLSADDAPARWVPPGVARLKEACPNEVGLFCSSSTKHTKTLLACLRGLEGGVSKPCRKALRAND